MKKITPNLWFDKEAKEASKFYTSVFDNSKITSTRTLHDTPSGDTDIVAFTLEGQPFMAISAGPVFKLNPSISFMLNFDPSREKKAKEKLDTLWDKLSDGGKILMAIDKYPFSERYGWLQDKYGVSWQLILTKPDGEHRPFIVPSLLFVGDVCGKAEDAIKFYVSVFSKKGASKVGVISRYGKGHAPDKEDNLNFADFSLLGNWFAAMDSAHKHEFSFNEAISFIVLCDDQEEIDYYWEKLSAVPASEQCGWLKDKYGVSWQIVPTAMDKIMRTKDEAALTRVTEAFLKMKKFDIAKLQKAFDGKA
jgi:predicted 3-demethylubiquinone-9 3-methyltransferase (glyoxalase superfamily)